MKPLSLSLFYFKTILLRLQATTNHVEVSVLLLLELTAFLYLLSFLRSIVPIVGLMRKAQRPL